MSQHLIEVCRQVGISLTFIKPNLSEQAPRISLFRRNPTDAVKYIVPPLSHRSSSPVGPFPPPLCPVIALPAVYLSLFSRELPIHRHF